jgi:plastocyanin
MKRINVVWLIIVILAVGALTISAPWEGTVFAPSQDEILEEEKEEVKETTTPKTTTSKQTSKTTTKPKTSGGTGTTPQPSGNVITYTNSGFVPKTLIIEQGKDVTFINNSSFAMRIMSDPHPSHDAYHEFVQGSSVGKGGKFSFSFLKVGVWGFHNDNKLEHQGFITVTPQSP